MCFGIVIPHLEYEYSQKLLEGIKQYIDESGNDILVYATNDPDNLDSDFSYQEWSISKFINSNNIKGIVIPTVSLTRYSSKEKIAGIINEIEKDIPVISIVTELEGIPSLIIKSEKSFKALINHILFNHGRKNILFIGVDCQSQDINDRITFFKEEMEKNGIKVPKHHIIFGNYTFQSGLEVMKKHFPTKESVDFDAVMCVTDELAIGAMTYLDSLGFSIPEDICVTGFDNSDWSNYTYPSLTTIDQEISRQTYIGFKLLEDRVMGKKVELQNILESQCTFRASCGCLEKDSNYIHKRQDGSCISRNEDFYSKTFRFMFQHNDQNLRILHFIEELQSYLSLDELCSRLEEYLYSFEINQSALCLYEFPIEVSMGEEYNMPSKARVFYYSDRFTNTKLINSKEFFDCEKKLLPNDMLENFKGIQILKSIYHGKYQYGYMILSLGSYDCAKYMMIYSLLNKFIASAYEVSHLEEKNNNLALLSNTDELTGILNRRGFNIAAQHELNIAAALGRKGLVIYGDMDGLKYINDTFGHDAGDRAIKAEVEILKKAFRATDTIGRLGGDEFAILSISLTFEIFENIKRNLDTLCEEWNETSKEKFKISISLGAVQFDTENYNLAHLLKAADAEQYKVKKAKKQNI